MASSPPNLILSINAGSSSVKITVYRPPESASSNHPDPIPLANASIDNITAPPAHLTYTLGSETKAKKTELPKEDVNDLSLIHI